MARLTKQARILQLLRDGLSLNRFEAMDHGDSVLPSTVAALRNKGWLVLTTMESVPTRWGCDVRVARYHLIGNL